MFRAVPMTLQKWQFTYSRMLQTSGCQYVFKKNFLTGCKLRENILGHSEDIKHFVSVVNIFHTTGLFLMQASGMRCLNTYKQKMKNV